MSTTTAAKPWTASLKVGELKEVLRSVPEASHCLERSELEQLVENRFGSLEEFQAALQRQPKAPNVDTTILTKKIQTILSQDRNILNFEDYTTSETHQKRMKDLAQVAPELYDNPAITPRSKWFSHSRFRQNSQMPPFHVHFRHELQGVVRSLSEAYNVAVNGSDVAKVRHLIQRADRMFQGSMRGLNGHVSIEEYACFPTYQSLYPHVPIQFLVEDHEHLHTTEAKVTRALRNISNKQNIAVEDLLSVLTTVVEFDDMLMSHLGEEEEVVVPMSLTEKNVHF